MAPAWTVTYLGETLIAGGEGIYRFVPGMVRTDYAFARLARGRGRIAKELGSGGTTHRMELEFDVARADVLDIFERIQGFLDEKTDGELFVPYYGTYRYCLLTDAQPGPQTPILLKLAEAGDVMGVIAAANKGFKLTFDCTFEQLR